MNNTKREIQLCTAPDGATYEINGEQLPVCGYVQSAGYGTVPLVDLHLMTDYEWQRRALDDRIRHPEKYSDTEDVAATVQRLTEWLLSHASKGGAA